MGLFSAEMCAGLLGQATGPDGSDIRVESFGAGEIALVFVHGGMCDRTYWSRQVADLASDYRVILVDLPGHGDSVSNRAEWSIDVLGEDVARAVEASRATQCILVGHSLGGVIAVSAAAKLGSAAMGVVVVDFLHAPGIAPPPRPPLGSVDQKEGMRRGMFSESTDSELRENIIRAMVSSPPDRVSALQGALGSFDEVAALEAIKTTPVSLILSDLRPADLNAISKTHRATRVSVIPGSGHFAMLEMPAVFNALLRVEVSIMVGEIRPLIPVC